jgi:predicted ester cyclase
VVVHWSASGTNTGAGNGLPATGKAVAGLWGMTIFRFVDGRIREEWTSFDQYAMLQELGLLGGGAATP